MYFDIVLKPTKETFGLYIFRIYDYLAQKCFLNVKGITMHYLSLQSTDTLCLIPLWIEN